jgi:hypothetical protein
MATRPAYRRVSSPLPSARTSTLPRFHCYSTPFFALWASATVDEIISALHRKALLGVV